MLRSDSYFFFFLAAFFGTAFLVAVFFVVVASLPLDTVLPRLGVGVPGAPAFSGVAVPVLWEIPGWPARNTKRKIFKKMPQNLAKKVTSSY